ncbi:MAG: sensor histidine kinase, partial [Gorillibacterium sp.]|nr:sensor histidine kinase [Gorillibacterium sp.]
MKRKLGFLSKVNDVPLRYKVLLVYVTCVLIPIVLLNVLFLNRISQNIKTKEYQNLEISMSRASKEINELIEGVVGISHVISTDKSMYEALDSVYPNSSVYYNAYLTLLKDKVAHYMPVNAQLEQITVITDNPTIQSGGNYFLLDTTMTSSEWYHKVMTSKEKIVLYAYRSTSVNYYPYAVPHLSVFMRLNTFDDTNVYTKILKVDISLHEMLDVIVQEKGFLKLYIVNAENQIILESDKEDITIQEEDYPLFSSDQLDSKRVSFQEPIGQASYLKGWRMVGIAEGNGMSQELKKSRDFVMLLAATCTIVTTLLIFIILRSYNYRVKRLSRHMKQVKNGKFDLLILDEGRDEIGELIRDFNRMTAKINSLINDVYKLELQKKDLELERIRAELNVLQSQMNPHFLFNTLNAILVVCTRNQYTEVTEIIKSLAKIMRRLLSWQEDIVTLREEILFTEMYLKIEKFRFGDKFNYSITIDETVMDYCIPKMSIQPLVENAILHGVESRIGPGTVAVSVVRAAEAELSISVEDDGEGMDEETLRALLVPAEGGAPLSAKKSGVGIANVRRRLRLYFDEEPGGTERL